MDEIDNSIFNEKFLNNLSLLKSFKAVGHIIAITLLTEINSINNFTKPKQLVAFLGIDPSVNQ